MESRITELQERVVALTLEAQSKDNEIARLAAASGVLGNFLDLAVGPRESLTADRARELLAPVLLNASHAERVTRVCLGTKSFGMDAAVVAAEALKTMSKLSQVDFGDIIAGRMEAEALEVLACMCGALSKDRVRMLDLSDNALGEKGMRVLEPVLRDLTGIERLRFHNNGLSELAVDLLAGYCPTARLVELSFHNNMSGDGGAVALSKLVERCPGLSTIRMSSSRVRSTGGCALVKSLAGRLSLREVDLSDSMFGIECAEILAETLATLPNLVKLSIRDSGLEEDGVAVVLKALEDPATCPLLEELNLSALDLEADEDEEEEYEHVAALLRIVASKPALRVLELDENQLKSCGVAALAVGLTAMSHNPLEVLSMKCNEMGSLGAIALARFASKSKTMKRLEMDENAIAPAGLVRVEEVLTAAGKKDMASVLLASLDANEPDDDEDEVPAAQDADQQDDLVALMGGAKLSA